MKPFVIAVLGVLLTACVADELAQPATAEIDRIRQVDTLYVNGVIWTGRDNAADLSSIAVRGGRLVDPVDVVAAKTIDLGGRFVMPGFIDNHVHFIEGGMSLASVELRDATTQDEFKKRIAAFASKAKPGRWILTGNWDHEWWGGELPRKDWIDVSTSKNPTFVARLDGHMALANSLALQLAGIDENTPSPAGGEIVKDENGQPTGILKDNAMELVLRVVPEPSDEENLEAFALAQQHAFSVGLTQIHAMTAYPSETNMLEIFQLAQRAGVLKIRAMVYTPIEDLHTAANKLKNESFTDKLRWGGVKGLVDGSLGSSTAWFYEPFTDKPDNRGFPLQDPEEFTQLMATAEGLKLKLAIHAIGDKAIDSTLSGFKTIAGDKIKDHRFRIEHFQHPSRTAINTAAESGVIASMQPYHAIDDGRWAEKRIGAERIKTTYAFRTILDVGGILTFGSDWPVAPLSPLAGVFAAVTRRTIDDENPDGWQPLEKISVTEALTAYTSSNAYAVFDEQNTGTLLPGKQADFIILDNDPRRVESSQIRNIAVLATFVNGEQVFGNDEWR